MKCLSVAIAAFALTAGMASAATFTPEFDTPSFMGSVFDVESDPSYNAYYSANFGITVENAYLYKDVRDVLDGIGIANGTKAGNSQLPQFGRINFLDKTDFVTIDYWGLLQNGTWSAFSSGGVLIDSFSNTSAGEIGKRTLSGGVISYIEFGGSNTGTVTVSSLTYSFDGTTDGVNKNLPGITAVPLPAGGLLLISGLAGVAALKRRKQRAG